MVDFTAEQVDRAIKMLNHLPGEAQKAMANAMNRAIDGAHTAAARKIAARYRIKPARAKEGIGKARHANPADLHAGFDSIGRRPTLYQYGPSPSQPGTGGAGRPSLRVAVLRSHGKKKLRHAFALGGKANADGARNMLVGWRIRGTQMKSNHKKEKIQGLYGPAIPQMLGQESVLQAVEKVARERLDARLDHEIERALERAGRR